MRRMQRERCGVAAMAAVVLALGAAAPAQAITFYLDGSAAIEGNGASWATPFKTLSNAVARVTTGAEIWVAQGTYTWESAAGLSVSNHKLLGGFTNGMATADARDWTLYPTILDGEGARRVFTKTAAGTFTLDGFTLRNGATAGGAAGNGGAISCTAGALVIRNCVFVDNLGGGSGGAIHHAAVGADNVFSNCAFTGNWAGTSAGYFGGALYAVSASTNTVTACTFTANRAPNAAGAGGAISLNAVGGLLRITACTFTNNLSGTSGGGAVHSLSRLDLSGGGNIFNGNQSDGYGGAIYQAAPGAENVFSNCTFTANWAGSGGGYLGGALYLGSVSTNTFSGCVFAVNRAPNVGGGGGAISLNAAGGLLRLTDCTFSTNRAGTGSGGAVHSLSRLDLTGGNNVFTGNQLTGTGEGGAIFTTAALAARDSRFVGNTANNGGAIRGGGAAVNAFSNCTFTANAASSAANGGGALFLWGAGGATLMTNVFDACTFTTNQAAGNYGGAIAQGGGSGASLLQLTGCSFTNNFAKGDAGAVRVLTGSVKATRTTFVGNACLVNGGAVTVDSAGAQNAFSNCTFTANAASGSANGGGAAFLWGSGSANAFDACTFTTNQATAGYGGAIVQGNNAAQLQLTDCAFANNSSVGDGGAVKLITGGLMARRTDFVGNASQNYGGAMDIRGATLHTFTNCSFVANTAGGASPYSGGALFLYTGSGGRVLVNGCTFYTNRATSASGVGGAIYAGGASAMTALSITDCIFRDNQAATGREIARALVSTFTLGYTSIDTNGISGIAPVYGDGMLDVDPLFASAVAPYDLHLKSLAGRWDPTTAQWVLDAMHSPGIDAGDPAGAFALESAPNGGRVNLGRYGNTAQASKSFVPVLSVLGTDGSVIAIDAAAGVAAGTDFAMVNAAAPATHVFTITNSGPNTLNLTGDSAIAISGDTDVFTTNGLAAATSVPPGGRTTFAIRFAPTLSQPYAAVVSIANDDPTVNPYTFPLAGIGVSTFPSMDVLDPSGAVLPPGAAASVEAGTDFGIVITNLVVDRMFTITNFVSPVLRLTGTPPLAISGHTSDFFITGTPAATNIAAGSTTFQLRFQPTARGVRTALVSIANNVPNKDPYTFALTGVGDAGSEIAVLGTDGLQLANGAGATETAGTDYGILDFEAGAVDHTFTITNSGVNPLTFDSVVLSGAAPFTAESMPVSPVAPGGTAALTIRFTPSVGGKHTAQVTLANNTLNEDPYTFSLRGYVVVPAVEGIVYVDPDAPLALETGDSWSRAHRTLTNALAASPPGSTFWLAEGTYGTASSGAGMELNASSLLGGFAGVETNVNERDWVLHPTILDGGGARRVLRKAVAGTATLDGLTVKGGAASPGAGLYATAGSLTIRNCVFTNNITANNGGAIFHSAVDADNVFSNCIFAANAQTTAVSAGYRGGAIHIALASTNTFLSCLFSGNTALGAGYGWTSHGGAIADVQSGLLRLADCTFLNNTCSGSGGAILSVSRLDLSVGTNVFAGNRSGAAGGAIYHSQTDADNVFSNCAFIANSAGGYGNQHGGAIYYALACSNAFTACRFEGNRALGSGYGINSGGGAIYEGTAGGVLRLASCTFSNNACSASGGAIGTGSRLELSGDRNLFYGNQSGGVGGAIYHALAGADNVFSNCTFTANTAGGAQNHHGGAIYFGLACTNTFAGCDFEANRAPGSGYGLFSYGGAVCSAAAGTQDTFSQCAFIANAGYHGGALFLSSGAGGKATVNNCTFFTNSAAAAGGAIWAGGTEAMPELNIRNSIFRDNQATTGKEIARANVLSLKIDYTCIDTSLIDGIAPPAGDGVINEDPLFASATLPYDVHLKSKFGRWWNGGWMVDPVQSPCIDAGDPASDYSLEPGGNGARINMGRYGNTAEASWGAGSPNGLMIIVR